MKPIHIAALAAAVAILTTLIVVPLAAAETVSYVRPADPPRPAIGTRAQLAWLAKLVQCESGGNADAINPKDSDGTPSYGLLQFKPSTFALFSKAYGVEGSLMDPNAQRTIVLKMMDDETVNFRQQFPDCTRKLGLPPKNG